MKQRHVDSFAPEMAAVVAGVHPLLKEAGFRKSRHLFNRDAAEPGLVHLLEFQMGQVWGAHGRFAINYGFDAAEVRALRGWPDRRFVKAYEGAGWTRVAGGSGERWFDLMRPADELVEQVTESLRDEVFPLLDGLQTRRHATAPRVVSKLRVPPAAVAVMLHHLGDVDEARRVFVEGHSGATGDPERAATVREHARKIFGADLPDLGP
ncbi:MAG TPA: DUF4304 domain-containing protein [Actinomycetota bacterium]|nr:DUF4304 domain-containing protein [Actinomycetota bacterium]